MTFNNNTRLVATIKDIGFLKPFIALIVAAMYDTIGGKYRTQNTNISKRDLLPIIKLINISNQTIAKAPSIIAKYTYPTFYNISEKEEAFISEFRNERLSSSMSSQKIGSIIVANPTEVLHSNNSLVQTTSVSH